MKSQLLNDRQKIPLPQHVQCNTEETLTPFFVFVFYLSKITHLAPFISPLDMFQSAKLSGWRQIAISCGTGDLCFQLFNCDFLETSNAQPLKTKRTSNACQYLRNTFKVGRAVGRRWPTPFCGGERDFASFTSSTSATCQTQGTTCLWCVCVQVFLRRALCGLLCDLQSQRGSFWAPVCVFVRGRG